MRYVEFHPFGEFFASGSSDASVKIWDVRRKGCIQTYTGHQGPLNVLRITPDGRWIATGGEDGVVKVEWNHRNLLLDSPFSNYQIWDMTAGKILKSISDHIGPITCVSFSPAEFIMASASTDNSLKIIDLQNFEIVHNTQFRNTPRCVCFEENEGKVLSVALPDSLKVNSRALIELG